MSTTETAKTDCFGITHRPKCKRPGWRIISDPDHPRQLAQRCIDCHIIWRRGDDATTPQPAQGWTNGRNRA